MPSIDELADDAYEADLNLIVYTTASKQTHLYDSYAAYGPNDCVVPQAHYRNPQQGNPTGLIEMHPVQNSYQSRIYSNTCNSFSQYTFIALVPRSAYAA